ncbi:hypothetical protein P5V15_012633 [Pogonomyrmex californicus]
MSTVSTTMNDSEEYYCFRVKERIDSELGENIVIIQRSYNFDLKKLRTDLWKQFGVPKDRRIFYIDDDGDDVPIDSECEFHEALKLAKSAFVVNTAIPLIVGSFHTPTSCSDDEQGSEICSSKEQPKSINSNPISFTEKNNSFMSESNFEFDKQKCSIQKISSNQKKLDIKQSSDESNKEQMESKEMEIPKELNASLQCSDMVPPQWFIKYMEMMKKDMVSMITNEVVKNVTEVLNKRLDSFAYPPLKELDQSRSQSYSSLSKRHPRCSFNANEKTQKRMSSQDEEQSSDASIERVDEPQNTNTTENMQTKKDVISTISQEVVKEMTEMLNKLPLDPFISVPSKKLGQSRGQSHLSSSKRFSRHFDSHSSEKNQRKMRPQDGEQSSDDASTGRTYEPRNTTNTTDISRRLQKNLDLIGAAICASVKEEKRKKKYHQRVAQVTSDNSNDDVNKEQEQSIQNNAREEFISQRNLLLQTDSIPYDEPLGIIDNELRMSCSVTGHQILDENRRSKDAWCCDNTDIDKTSFWSCDQEEEDDDAFEIIQMPASGSRDESVAHPEEPVIEQRRHDSNRDSPSFELLSEPPSPIPTCFMYFNEEHFSANEGNSEGQSLHSADMNPKPTNSIYVVDIHGKIYSERQWIDSDECISTDLKKRSGGTYSFVTETLPVQDTCCSKLSHSEQRSSERKKGPQEDTMNDICDNTKSSYDDVRNSHTSYLNVRTHCDSKTQSQCSCESQTDSNDFTQSFHSHTTDTTDIYTEAYGSGRYNEQMPSMVEDLREASATTVTATATATVTATTASRNGVHDVHVSGGCTKEARTNGKNWNCNADNYSECSYTLHNCASQGTSNDTSYQSSRTNGSDRPSSNVGSRKTSIGETLGTDPVHILPETLVTAAAQVGSLAYDTAREMFDKIRAHTREDSVKRRGGVKSDDKKRFFVGPLSLY